MPAAEPCGRRRHRFICMASGGARLVSAPRSLQGWDLACQLSHGHGCPAVLAGGRPRRSRASLQPRVCAGRWPIAKADSRWPRWRCCLLVIRLAPAGVGERDRPGCIDAWLARSHRDTLCAAALFMGLSLGLAIAGSGRCSRSARADLPGFMAALPERGRQVSGGPAAVQAPPRHGGSL